MVVLPVAMDLDKYIRKAPTAEWPTVFHLAFMEWMPNQEALTWLLDEAWPLVEAQIPQARLIACGMKMPEYLRQRSGGQVTIGGEVEDAIEFLYQYGVMAVPLWSGSGTRIKILEGLAAGKPIVTTSVGLQGIPAKHGEHLLVADTPGGFCRRYTHPVTGSRSCAGNGRPRTGMGERNVQPGCSKRQTTGYVPGNDRSQEKLIAFKYRF